jgi:hypothetical protein
MLSPAAAVRADLATHMALGDSLGQAQTQKVNSENTTYLRKMRTRRSLSSRQRKAKAKAKAAKTRKVPYIFTKRVALSSCLCEG